MKKPTDGIKELEEKVKRTDCSIKLEARRTKNGFSIKRSIGAGVTDEDVQKFDNWLTEELKILDSSLDVVKETEGT